jgi:transcriptional regulator with XRE-family HTH domain
MNSQPEVKLPVVTVMWALRKAKNLTQIELGQMVELSQSEISLAETRQVRPREETLKKLAEALGVTDPDDLFMSYEDWFGKDRG